MTTIEAIREIRRRTSEHPHLHPFFAGNRVMDENDFWTDETKEFDEEYNRKEDEAWEYYTTRAKNGEGIFADLDILKARRKNELNAMREMLTHLNQDFPGWAAEELPDYEWDHDWFYAVIIKHSASGTCKEVAWKDPEALMQTKLELSEDGRYTRTVLKTYDDGMVHVSDKVTIERTWYAVMANRDDQDWGYGSYDINEAKTMCRDYGPEAYICVVDVTSGANNGVATGEITQDEF